LPVSRPVARHLGRASLGTLRAAGFSMELTAHAYALLDAFVCGFAVQETSLPFEGPEEVSPQVTRLKVPSADNT